MYVSKEAGERQKLDGASCTQKHLPLHTTVMRADLSFRLKKNSFGNQGCVRAVILQKGVVRSVDELVENVGGWQ